MNNPDLNFKLETLASGRVRLTIDEDGPREEVIYFKSLPEDESIRVPGHFTVRMYRDGRWEVLGPNLTALREGARPDYYCPKDSGPLAVFIATRYAGLLRQHFGRKWTKSQKTT